MRKSGCLLGGTWPSERPASLLASPASSQLLLPSPLAPPKWANSVTSPSAKAEHSGMTMFYDQIMQAADVAVIHPVPH